MPLGAEIWTQTEAHIDAFVHAVGTAHSIHGVTRALRGRGAKLRVIDVTVSGAHGNADSVAHVGKR